MIGTGVFTSLGFQLIDIQSAPVIMMLWLVGGISALCGALSYAELGAALPRSGGEYHFLNEIYHPCAGFISGWVSATVGFAAPTALAALTFGSYLNSSGLHVDPLWLATLAIVSLTAAHCSNHRRSGETQTGFTALKILLILGFSLAALALSPTEKQAEFAWTEDVAVTLGSGAFAVSLIYVNYAYSGWNAATYISGELSSPQRSLPWVL
ncbi:MAG: amino acid permease, partial [Luminiphilus sp.]|nr:amino acid permease [Luminiphilus sp.]